MRHGVIEFSGDRNCYCPLITDLEAGSQQSVETRLRSHSLDGVMLGSKALAVFFFFFFSPFFFLGLHLQHKEVPRLGVELELQLPAYTTARAMQDLSRICNLCHSSRQRKLLNPLSGARDRTHILLVTSWVDHLLSHNRNSS